ncbi:putative metal-dependent hydrolase [Sphingobacteriales bacterium UPWRP_1]|nr:metal-dependent hydrolase [Sphingobacteriales bacterium TSM_CSS]PSJ72510.1 putative metal-dependent hydrolase [Sphingobacteriales bacterium UPWRP_1]
MNDLMLEAMQYPIGRCNKPNELSYSPEETAARIAEIAQLPQLLSAEVSELTDEQLDTPYRPGGWTIRQVVHHLADSHMNSFIRFKLALTEDTPTIKPYREDLWAKQPDYEVPVMISLLLLTVLHTRWVFLLRSLTPQQLQRSFYHPDNHLHYTLQYAIAVYGWHGRHHLAHIQSVKLRKGWK